MEMVTNGNGMFTKKHEERLLNHDDGEAEQLLDNSEQGRGKKKKKKF
jgi:hypothetical protein